MSARDNPRVHELAHQRSIRNYARTVPRHTDFDFAAVERAIDGEAPPAASDAPRGPNAPGASPEQFLKEIVAWLAFGDGKQLNGRGNSTFARVLVLGYYLELEGLDVSLAEIAAKHGGGTRAALNKHLRSFNERFGVFAAEQRRRTHRRQPRVSTFAKAFAAESAPTTPEQNKFAGLN